MFNNSEIYETSEFKSIVGGSEPKKRLVATFCYFLDLELMQLKKIKAAKEIEKAEHEKRCSGVKYIVSKTIHKMYAVLDQIDKEKLQAKQQIKETITEDEYRKLIRGIL